MVAYHNRHMTQDKVMIIYYKHVWSWNAVSVLGSENVVFVLGSQEVLSLLEL